MSSCSCASSGPASVRSVTAARSTLRSTGPRPRSITATTTLELLGTSNAIPSSCGPRVATLTRSPVLISSMSPAYCARSPGPCGELLGVAQTLDAGRRQRPRAVGDRRDEPVGLQGLQVEHGAHVVGGAAD